jgi:hypothetical protein
MTPLGLRVHLGSFVICIGIRPSTSANVGSTPAPSHFKSLEDTGKRKSKIAWFGLWRMHHSFSFFLSP